MTTAQLHDTTYPLPDTESVPASARGRLARVWSFLVDAGQRRAAGELARYVRLHGGRPTGDIAQDARQLAVLRGLR
jgi:hypothetical protein